MKYGFRLEAYYNSEDDALNTWKNLQEYLRTIAENDTGRWQSTVLIEAEEDDDLDNPVIKELIENHDEISISFN